MTRGPSRRRQVAGGLLFGILVASVGIRYSTRHVADFFPAAINFNTRSLQPNGVDKSKGDNELTTMNNITTGVMDWIKSAFVVQDKEQHPSLSPTPSWFYTHQKLKSMYTEFIEREAIFNNWQLGCNDLQMVAPYLKAILDRGVWGEIFRQGKTPSQRRKTVIDVGANNGDDALSILGIFQPIRGMCWRYGDPLLLLSIEPSPKVFCELVDALHRNNIHPTTASSSSSNDHEGKEIHLMNVALSERRGNLIFQDPGNEGGRIIGGDYTDDLSLMTPEEWSHVTKCHLSANEVDQQAVDYKRETTVPTYTLDLLMESLDHLGVLGNSSIGSKGIISKVDQVFVLKIDTEGHDYKVLLGAKSLLEQKKIEFVIFETSKNYLLKASVEFMSSVGYECYLLAPKWLVPLHVEQWWYDHLDNYTTGWWANVICAESASQSMRMLWTMYHSDDLMMANSYNILYNN